MGLEKGQQVLGLFWQDKTDRRSPFPGGEMAAPGKDAVGEGHIDEGLGEGLLQVFAALERTPPEAEPLAAEKVVHQSSRFATEGLLAEVAHPHLAGAIEDDDIKERHQERSHKDLDKGHVRSPQKGIDQGRDKAEKSPGDDGVKEVLLADDEKGRQGQEEGQGRQKQILDVHRSAPPPVAPQPTR